MRYLSLKILVLFMTLLPLTSGAVTVLILDNSGQLVGATGVEVSGVLYDVSFTDEGVCSDLFNGCDEPSDFTFNTVANATLASQALLDQVLVGQFDTDPHLTQGCFLETVCRFFTVYASDVIGNEVFLVRAENNGDNIDDVISLLTVNGSTSTTQTSVWAQWTPSASQVPLPGALILMMSGLVGLGVFRQRNTGSTQT